ncbi:helix-turn-helix domain-containing protein [Cellulomonas sp. FA1]|uniref:helix-turn-helix domain-containing protein n=1 Tax=Cellulomonas sp. FA1 TaxID=1346710 RepID=UPI00069B034D|nr:helix-turn-helix domain-containing protein [Cellulomonas sp. FA1]
MATATSPTRLFTHERDADLARDVLGTLEGPEGYLSVGRGDTAQPLPRDVGVLLQQVLEAIASGATVTVTATPSEITTSTAAAMLGVSRPTLMKMIARGDVAAHKVGTHTRLRTEDVLAARSARRRRERAAFAALLEAEGDEA